VDFSGCPSQEVSEVGLLVVGEGILLFGPLQEKCLSLSPIEHLFGAVTRSLVSLCRATDEHLAVLVRPGKLRVSGINHGALRVHQPAMLVVYRQSQANPMLSGLLPQKPGGDRTGPAKL